MKGPPYGALAALGLAALWPLRKALWGGVLYYRDIHLVWHARAEAFVRVVAGGSLPLWNDLPGFGQPMLADPAYMAAYPLTWLNLLMPAWAYYTLFAALHLFWTGLGLFLLGRRYGSSATAALTGAGVWVLSGPMLSLVSLWHHFASSCWIPWVFLTADRALLTKRRRHALAWGLAMAAQILGGSADVAAMTLLALAAYALSYRVQWRRVAGLRNRARLATSALALAFALGLSAVQWMPALELLQGSVRWTLAEDTRIYWSVHPLRVLQALVPSLWQDVPLRKELGAAMFESREPFLLSLYVGLATLPLAGAALAFRCRRGRFFALLALGALLVALGRHAPVYGSLITVLPPLRILRYPEKAFGLVAFGWAVLCGLGAQAWRARGPVSPGRWAAAVLAPVAAAGTAALSAAMLLRLRPGIASGLLALPDPHGRALAGTVSRLLLAAGLACCAVSLAWLRWRRPAASKGLAAAAALLAVGDLALAHADAVAVAPPLLYARPPLVEELRRQRAERVYVYDYTNEGALARLLASGRPRMVADLPDWPPAATFALGQQMHLQPNTGGRWNVATGYERDLLGLASYEASQLVLLLPELEGTPLHLRLLRMGAVTHVVTLHQEGLGDLRPVAALPWVFDRPIHVYAVPEPLPRAYAVAGARVADGREAFAAVLDASFDPAREVVVPGGTVPAAPGGVAGRVRITDRRADRVRLEAEMERVGQLVVVESHAPGWRVTVDGQAAPLLRANLAFRAVPLSAGRHTVEMRYRPLGATAGMAATLFSGAAAMLLAMRGQKRTAAAHGWPSPAGAESETVRTTGGRRA